MRNVINSLQKTIRLKVLCTLLIICCNLTITIAQYPVRSQITFIPPYSPNLSDYYTGTTERFIVTLTNTDFANPLRKVRLRLNIKSNAISLRSKDNIYYPTIELDAGIPTRLSLSDLEPYFNPNNIDASGVDYGFLAKSPRLPDGYYAFRFDVIDANTGQVLNNTLLGEQNIRITTNDPPLLNLPRSKDNIAFRDPINIIFNWTPRHIGISSAEYEFSLYEINDNGMPPENAPFISQPIYQTTSYTTTLLYGPTEPQLLPGKRYAWRVKATAMSGGDAYDLFRNNGYSETYWFQLNDNCPPIQQVVATVKNGAVTISWLDNPQMYEYTVEYRKVGNATNRWFTTTTRTNRVVITNVSENNTYEYRVGGTCTVGAGPTFSDVKAFTIPPRDSIRDKQCGIMPNINLSNKTAIDKLNIGDVVNVGDFPVMITDLTSTVGSFSGKGYITIPFLGDVRVKVKFDNVLFNTDKQLIQGFMITTYDKTESQIVDLDKIFDEDDSEISYADPLITNGKYNVDFSFDDVKDINVKKDEQGKYIVEVTLNGGQIKQIVVNEIPTTIEDKNGNVYAINKDGSIKKLYDKATEEVRISDKNKNIYYIMLEGDTTKYRTDDRIYITRQNANIKLILYDSAGKAANESLMYWKTNIDQNNCQGQSSCEASLKDKGGYKIIAYRDKEALIKVQLVIYHKPTIIFERSSNYKGEYGFDDGFKYDELKKDYQTLNIYGNNKDYYVPWLFVMPNQTAMLKLNVKGLGKDAEKDKNFKVYLKSTDESVIKINMVSKIEMGYTELNSNPTINIFIKDAFGSWTLNNSKYIYALNNKGDTLGKILIKCEKEEGPRPLALIYVKHDRSGYRNTDANSITLLNYLNTYSHNQLLLQWQLAPKSPSQYVDTLDISAEYNANSSKYTESGTKALYELLDLYKSKTGIDIRNMDKVNTYKYFFITNIATTPDEDEGQTGGIYRIGGNYGTLYRTAGDATEHTAHELGHGLGFSHTFCCENNNCKDVDFKNRCVRKGNTKNFMDYIDRGRNTWFIFQFKKIVRPL